MRNAVAAVVLSILAVVPAEADQPVEPEEIVAAAKPLRDAWDRCLALAVKPALGSDQPAETVADRALDRCRAREASLRALLVRRIGPVRAARILAEARDGIRSGLIETIEALRSP